MKGRVAYQFALLCSVWLFAACGQKVSDPIPEDAPRRYAEAVCGTVERCQCLGESLSAGAAVPFASHDECLRASADRFRRVSKWPDAKFDAECFDRVLEFISQHECRGAAEADFEPLPCLVFGEGGKPQGSSCTPDWSRSWRDAQSGLLAAGECANGTCWDGTCGPHERDEVSEGDSCALELGVGCDDGTYCGSDGKCRPQVEAGAACDSPWACAPTFDEVEGVTRYYYCAGLTRAGGSGRCEPKIEEGGSCSPDEVESCAPLGYCADSGECASHWPLICSYLVGPPQDAYWPGDWVPLK